MSDDDLHDDDRRPRGGSHREHREWHRRVHALRRERWAAILAEKELWRRQRHDRSSWSPWWLQARMRRRIFIWFGVALVAGAIVGAQLHAGQPRWWSIIGSIAILWAGSGAIAWRLTRPLLMMVKAARDIGDGKLDTRLDVRHHGGEMRLLASAINEMAARIAQQLGDQRQLLAAVSHELRTPLGHMRVLIETAREQERTLPAGESAAALDGLEREVLELDDLVGKLLAQSRLEFGQLDRRMIDLGELVSDAATQVGVPPEAIEAVGDVRASVDAALIRRAIANVLDNARTHGGGAIAVRIDHRGSEIAIEVDDAGPGVPADRRADAFRAFVPSSGGGLGLGLALVHRIAAAHGGRAWIADRPGGGARVGFAIAVVASR